MHLTFLELLISNFYLIFFSLDFVVSTYWWNSFYIFVRTMVSIGSLLFSFIFYHCRLMMHAHIPQEMEKQQYPILIFCEMCLKILQGFQEYLSRFPLPTFIDVVLLEISLFYILIDQHGVFSSYFSFIIKPQLSKQSKGSS